MHNNKKSDLILDSMQRLMQKKDTRSISVSEIAKEAGIGKGSIYYYFKSKEEIVDAVIERSKRQRSWYRIRRWTRRQKWRSFSKPAETLPWNSPARRQAATWSGSRAPFCTSSISIS